MIVLPELALCSYMGNAVIWQYADKNSVDTGKWAMDMAGKYNAYIATGYPERYGDEYYNLLFSVSNAVFSYGSALYLLGLSEKVPLYYDVSVPYGFNVKSIRINKKIKLHYVKRELFDLGKIKIKSPQGQIIICYTTTHIYFTRRARTAFW